MSERRRAGTDERVSGPLGLAIVGCGTISNQYLKNLTQFPDVRVLFCADIDSSRAKAQAAAYGVPGSGSVEQALEHPGVGLVVNLTIPAAHAQIAAAAVRRQARVEREAPHLRRGDWAAPPRQARAANLRVGCAPDTVLGAGIQSARRLIAEGGIGAPLSALVLLQGPGPEAWHPDPEFLFAKGAGPLFDLGPYYLSTLAAIFGPASRVAGVGRQARKTRTVGSGPKRGTEFPVQVPTYTAALAEYAGGPGGPAAVQLGLAPLAARVHRGHRHRSHPRHPGPEPLRRRPEDPPRGRQRLDRDPVRRATAGRGMGVVDMARAIAGGEPHRASGDLALHVLELMAKIDRSAATGQFARRDHLRHSRAAEPEWDPYAPAAG